MGNCVAQSAEETQEAAERKAGTKATKKIDRAMEKDKMVVESMPQLLLLGSGESGKNLAAEAPAETPLGGASNPQLGVLFTWFYFSKFARRMGIVGSPKWSLVYGTELVAVCGARSLRPMPYT